MKKQIMLKVYLVAFVVMIGIVAFAARKAEAMPSAGATLYPTVTGLEYGTPSAYSTPTARLYFPCSPVPDTTPLYGGTQWIMHTGTPLGTPIQPTLAPTVTLPYRQFNVIPSNGKGNMVQQSFTGNGLNELNQSHTYTFSDVTPMYFNTYVLMSEGFTGFRTDRNAYVSFDYWLSEDTGGTQVFYYDWNFDKIGDQFTCVSNYPVGHGQVTDIRGGIHWNYTCSGPSNWNGQQYTLVMDAVLSLSKYNVFNPPGTATPTAFPCQTLPDYGGSGNPIASFPPITYSYGGCTQILPAVHIPLGGLFGMPDVDFPGFSLCVMWVTLNAMFMGINLTSILAAFIIMGLGFAIFNEFRS